MAQCHAGLLFDKTEYCSSVYGFRCSEMYASAMLESAGAGVPGTRRACRGGVARHPLSGVHFHSPKVSAAHGGLTWNRLAHHVQAIPHRELIFPNKYAGETLLLGHTTSKQSPTGN